MSFPFNSPPPKRFLKEWTSPLISDLESCFSFQNAATDSSPPIGFTPIIPQMHEPVFTISEVDWLHDWLNSQEGQNGIQSTSPGATDDATDDAKVTAASKRTIFKKGSPSEKAYAELVSKTSTDAPTPLDDPFGGSKRFYPVDSPDEKTSFSPITFSRDKPPKERRVFSELPGAAFVPDSWLMLYHKRPSHDDAVEVQLEWLQQAHQHFREPSVSDEGRGSEGAQSANESTSEPQVKSGIASFEHAPFLEASTSNENTPPEDAQSASEPQVKSEMSFFEDALFGNPSVLHENTSPEVVSSANESPSEPQVKSEMSFFEDPLLGHTAPAVYSSMKQNVAAGRKGLVQSEKTPSAAASLADKSKTLQSVTLNSLDYEKTPSVADKSITLHSVTSAFSPLSMPSAIQTHRRSKPRTPASLRPILKIATGTSNGSSTVRGHLSVRFEQPAKTSVMRPAETSPSFTPTTWPGVDSHTRPTNPNPDRLFRDIWERYGDDSGVAAGEENPGTGLLPYQTPESVSTNSSTEAAQPAATAPTIFSTAKDTSCQTPKIDSTASFGQAKSSGSKTTVVISGKENNLHSTASKSKESAGTSKSLGARLPFKGKKLSYKRSMSDRNVMSGQS